VSDIDTAVVDSLKVLDPNRPIREAEVEKPAALVRFTSDSVAKVRSRFQRKGTCSGSFGASQGDYHWQHEPCWYAVRKKGNWTGDRKQTTLWQIPTGKQDIDTKHAKVGQLYELRSKATHGSRLGTDEHARNVQLIDECSDIYRQLLRSFFDIGTKPEWRDLELEPRCLES